MIRSNSILFSPITLGQVTVPNRFVRSAMCQRFGDEHGFPKKIELDNMIGLARGKVGLIVPGYMYPLSTGRTSTAQIGMTDTAHAEAWRSTIEEIHKLGSKVIFQICDGGITCPPEAIGGKIPRGCSPMGAGQREMTISEIEELIESYRRATKLLQSVGADGIQIHMCHGYLLSCFLSPVFNKRNDRYGGSAENRRRLPLEIARACKESIVSSYPFLLSVKINGHDCLPDKRFKETGVVPEECAETVSELVKAGVEFVEISGGMQNPMAMARVPLSQKTFPQADQRNDPQYKEYLKKAEEKFPFSEGYNLTYAAVVRAKNPKNKVKLAAPGGHRQWDAIEKAVFDEKVDMISFGRPFLRELDLVENFLHGQNETKCISCNLCLGKKGTRGTVCHFPSIN